MKKTLLLLVVIAVTSILTIALTHVNSPVEAPQSSVTETIRLYSDGELIGEWTGHGRGELQGNSYIFTVSRGAFREIVRIQGDFVVMRESN